MRRFVRFISLLLAFTFISQLAIAEKKILTVNKLYETDNSFSIEDDAIVKNLTIGSIGNLCIDGSGLAQVEESGFDVPVYVVSDGASVQFSLDRIKFLTNTKSDFWWRFADDSTSRIKQYDWKQKIGYGGILIQKSYDHEEWETVYTKANAFAHDYSTINHFYSAKRRDLSTGCFYRIIIACKTSRKTEQKSFLIFDTSSWENKYNVVEYDLFLIADESSGTAASVASDDAYVSSVSTTETGVVGSVFGNQTTANRVAGEEIFNAASGHGFAAEAANMQSVAENGILNGDTVNHTGANNAKYGSDYTITSRDGIITEIQSKYYNNPNATLNACFDETGKFVYYSNGVPMAIEVPADQYDRVLLLMRNKISQGLVPGVTDPADAEKIIRKGTVTYNQALNIAKAGNIDSLIYDAKNSCVSSASAFGVSAVVTFATSIWNQESIDVALQKSLYAGLKVGGNAFVTSILSSQLSRTGLNSLLVPGSEAIIHAIGPKASAVIINATRIGAKPIYGAAAMKSAAKLLRSNTITATVSLVLFTVPDIVDIFRGRISGKQLVKNLAETAGGIGGGMAGAAGGAALGTMIFPGVGTTIGGIIGALGAGIGGTLGVGAIADLIADDDADEMLDIITVEFQNLAEEYLLNSDEANNISNALQESLDANVLKDMFASGDQHSYARNMVERLVKNEVKKRPVVTIPSDEELAESMIDVLEDIYDEAELTDEEIAIEDAEPIEKEDNTESTEGEVKWKLKW